MYVYKGRESEDAEHREGYQGRERNRNQKEKKKTKRFGGIEREARVFTADGDGRGGETEGEGSSVNLVKIPCNLLRA